MVAVELTAVAKQAMAMEEEVMVVMRADRVVDDSVATTGEEFEAGGEEARRAAVRVVEAVIAAKAAMAAVREAEVVVAEVAAAELVALGAVAATVSQPCCDRHSIYSMQSSPSRGERASLHR